MEDLYESNGTFRDARFGANMIHFNGFPWKTMRTLCLYPITGQTSTLGDAINSLYSQWRARLYALRQAGWSTLTDGTRYRDTNTDVGMVRMRTMRNCVPFGGRVHREFRFTCQKLRICPMCYARQVVLDAWNDFQDVFKTLSRLDDKFMVASYSTKDWLLDDSPVANNEHKNADWAVRKARDGSTWDLRDLKKIKLFAEGARVNVTLEPVADQPMTVRMRRGTLAICRRVDPEAMEHVVRNLLNLSARQGDMIRENRIVHVYPIGKGEHLHQALVSAFHYPLGMLRGDAGMAAQLLNSMQACRARLSFSRGVVLGVKIIRHSGSDLSGFSDLPNHTGDGQ